MLLLLLLPPLALALPLACLPLALARLDMSLLVWPRLVLLVRLLLLGLAAWPVVSYAAAARLVANGLLVAFELRAAGPNSRGSSKRISIKNASPRLKTAAKGGL